MPFVKDATCSLFFAVCEWCSWFCYVYLFFLLGKEFQKNRYRFQKAMTNRPIVSRVAQKNWQFGTLFCTR